MRVLLAVSLGGMGHLRPVATAARAVEALGHDAVMLVPPSLAGAASKEGVRYEVGAGPPASVIDGIWRRVRRGPPPAVAGLIDRELFAGHGAQAMLGPCRELARRFQPELIIREPCEYASAVVAVEQGIPQAQIAISQAEVESSVLDMVAGVIDQYHAGLADQIRAAPYLTPFPETLDPSRWSLTRRFRPPEEPSSPAAAPDRTVGQYGGVGASAPLVYITFGTVLGHLQEARTTFAAVVEAVAPLDVRVLLSVGHRFDRTLLGDTPDNVRIEPWVPQAQALSQASLVVCHGGSGTTLGALAAGVPLVVCPLFADQPLNGRLVRAAGAGIVLPTPDTGIGTLGPDDIEPLRAAISRVLSDPAYARAAQAVGTELTEQPPLTALIGELTEAV
jgi:UDP:flavonoid glycosyltransferase YjiC (YdhE family)